VIPARALCRRGAWELAFGTRGAEPSVCAGETCRGRLGCEEELTAVRAGSGGEVPVEVRQAARPADDGRVAMWGARRVGDDHEVNLQRAGPPGHGAGERVGAHAYARAGLRPHLAGGTVHVAAVQCAGEGVGRRLVEEHHATPHGPDVGLLAACAHERAAGLERSRGRSLIGRQQRGRQDERQGEQPARQARRRRGDSPHRESPFRTAVAPHDRLRYDARSSLTLPAMFG